MSPDSMDRGETQTVDALFRCLHVPTRRRILFDLLEHNPQEPYLVPEDPHRGQAELSRFNVSLQHNHLPSLEDAGFIRWDREAGKVHKGPRFAEVRGLLEDVRKRVEDRTDTGGF